MRKTNAHTVMGYAIAVGELLGLNVFLQQMVLEIRAEGLWTAGSLGVTDKERGQEGKGGQDIKSITIERTQTMARSTKSEQKIMTCTDVADSKSDSGKTIADSIKCDRIIR